MKINPLFIVGISVCVFILSTVSSYLYNDERISDSDFGNDIEALEQELLFLKEQAQVLEKTEALMPVERNWLTVHRIIDRYPDLVWRASEDLEIATATENAWSGVLIASPDLLLPLMRLIQSKVPAEVSEIQLDRQQSVLLINILGIL